MLLLFYSAGDSKSPAEYPAGSEDRALQTRRVCMFIEIRHAPQCTTPFGVESLAGIGYSINMRYLRHHQFVIATAKLKLGRWCSEGFTSSEALTGLQWPAGRCYF